MGSSAGRRRTSSGTTSSRRQSAWNGSANQQWKITHRGDGRHSITDRGTGMALDGAGNAASGSVAEQWAYNGSTNLRWTFTAL
ncbi:RICIN domain-containing protein [Streptomyces sp. NPDC002324]